MDRILFSQFQKTDKFNAVLDNYTNKKHQLIHGLNEDGLAFLACNLNDVGVKKIIITTSTQQKAQEINDIINNYDETSVLFNTKEFILYNVDALSKEKINKRVNALYRILSSERAIVTASIESLLTKVVSKDKFKKNIIELCYGQSYNFNGLIEKLCNSGYERVDALEGYGQFSVRGGILDIFSLSQNEPYRVEFFDDEVDSIRVIDLKTQRTVRNEKKAIILPCSDVFFNSDEINEISMNLTKDYSKRIKKVSKLANGEEIKTNLDSLYEDYMEKLQEGLSIDNRDLLLPFVSAGFESVFDYFEEDALVILIEPDRIFDEIKALNESFLVKFTDLFEKGKLFTSQENLFLKKPDFENIINSRRIIHFNSIIKTNKNYKVEDICQIISKEATSYYGKMDVFSKDLNRYKYNGYKVVLSISSEEGCKKIHDILNDYNCSTILLGNTETVSSGQINIIVSKLKKGFEIIENKILILTENEIFGTFKKRAKSKKVDKKNKIESFTDLKVGDYVVHEYHGIGKYIGIEELNVQNVKKDYMCIKYKGEDKLYVPVDQMSLIQKYIGSDSTTPKINKMSSVDWNKTKERTRAAIENMAGELIELYAKRRVLNGYAFSSDNDWQKDFEYKFPFEETYDQLRCVEEIKADMEKIQPMDRLLCGDVGFGKTEVALRAVFKAVMDSKQVAILVPTTILAQQHYSNIIDRFRGYPVKIEMLSRFRTSKQQTKIIENINKGLVDVVVGTHKLLSKNIKFKDLGLLVIDEEQRFGVRHKESIKQLKANIDVLTLSATPIPRTLHMSMIGVRDMSVIEDPPGDRMPIQTYVIEHNEGIIKDAIEKEISRGGQIYYVHNKVIGIESVANTIRRLVPEARVVVGHGQMNEKDLENVMISFVNKEYDVLVCTTIIETGMDIPNVNTLIIDNAENFGLSQLYQLRGRVGRSNKTSFAYLTYEKNKVLTEIADKRLKAIKEFTEFGSGFKIAMRDLEIRGCGNILGAEQHGHMIAIGYDLYVKYLDMAVKKLSGIEIEEEQEISIDLNVDAYISPTYIENEEQKIEIYKKIAAISNEDDVTDVTDEILDRFGTIPKEVDKLIRVAYIKTLCKKLNIKGISQNKNVLAIEFGKTDDETKQYIDMLIKNNVNRIKFDVSDKLTIKLVLSSVEQNKVLEEIRKLFEDVIGK